MPGRGAVLPAAGEPGPPVTVDRLPAREAAERELSKRIYAEHEPGLASRAWDWVWDHVLGALESAAFRAPGGWLGLLLIAVVAAGLIIALRLRLGALRAATGPRRGSLFTDRPLSAGEHRAAAASHAQAQRWDQAVQEELRAIVRSLEERSLLDPRPGRTADEAAAEAGLPLPALAARLRAAATTFDAVTYGGQHATAADYARLCGLNDELRHARPVLGQPTSAGAAP